MQVSSGKCSLWVYIVSVMIYHVHVPLFLITNKFLWKGQVHPIFIYIGLYINVENLFFLLNWLFQGFFQVADTSCSKWDFIVFIFFKLLLFPYFTTDTQTDTNRRSDIYSIYNIFYSLLTAGGRRVVELWVWTGMCPLPQPYCR